MIIILYHKIKILINFWYRQRLNLKSLIQPLKKKKKILATYKILWDTIIFSAHIPGFLVHPCGTVGINLQCITETITHDILYSCIKH